MPENKKAKNVIHGNSVIVSKFEIEVSHETGYGNVEDILKATFDDCRILKMKARRQYDHLLKDDIMVYSCRIQHSYSIYLKKKIV